MNGRAKIMYLCEKNKGGLKKAPLQMVQTVSLHGFELDGEVAHQLGLPGDADAVRD